MEYEEKLILLKNNIKKKLDNLIQDETFYILSHSVEYLKNTSLCFEMEDPIDLDTIKNNIFSVKYKNKKLIIDDLKKAFNNTKNYYKINEKEKKDIIIAENKIKEIIEFIENY